MKNLRHIISLILLATVCISSNAERFKKFKVAFYCRAWDFVEMEIRPHSFKALLIK